MLQQMMIEVKIEQKHDFRLCVSGIGLNLYRVHISQCLHYSHGFIYVCVSPQKMDKNRDGVVTLDEFILSCQEVLLSQILFSLTQP